MGPSETYLLCLFVLVSYVLLLICHFVYSRKKNEAGGGEEHKGGIKVKSSILIRATTTKKNEGITFKTNNFHLLHS